MARHNMHDEQIKARLEERWVDSKKDRDYATRIAKRDENIVNLEKKENNHIIMKIKK